MKRILLLLVVAATCNAMAEDASLDSPTKRASYAMGTDIAKNLGAQGIEVDLESFTAGFKAQQEGTSALSDEEIRTEIMNLQMRLRENMQKKQEEAAANAPKYKEDGMKFLEENKAKDGVIETASGLQYKVITAGEGDKPAATDTVKVHYTGRLLDGTVFDSSVERGEPVEFPLNGVIPGWTEGVQLMGKGAKFQFWIPSDLAYGDGGAPGGTIPPGSTLEFEVELLEIVE